MERIEYVKAAFRNDESEYDLAKIHAWYWHAESEDWRNTTLNDIAILDRAMVERSFPWLDPTDAEIKEGYRELMEEIADGFESELMAVRSGSAVYWNPGEACYLVCERSAYCDCSISIVCKTDDFGTALAICDNRAGVCRPMEVYTEHAAICA